MPCVVITGRPGAGKTTLLQDLARLGHRTVPESARAVIAQRMAQGLCPTHDAKTFALEILRRDFRNHENPSASSDWVLFDRAVPEALAMAQKAGALDFVRSSELRRRQTVHQRFCFLPPWPASVDERARRVLAAIDAYVPSRRATGPAEAPKAAERQAPAPPSARLLGSPAPR